MWRNLTFRNLKIKILKCEIFNHISDYFLNLFKCQRKWYIVEILVLKMACDSNRPILISSYNSDIFLFIECNSDA